MMEKVGTAEIIDNSRYAILNVVDGKQQADYYSRKLVHPQYCMKIIKFHCLLYLSFTNPFSYMILWSIISCYSKIFQFNQRYFLSKTISFHKQRNSNYHLLLMNMSYAWKIIAHIAFKPIDRAVSIMRIYSIAPAYTTTNLRNAKCHVS